MIYGLIYVLFFYCPETVEERNVLKAAFDEITKSEKEKCGSLPVEYDQTTCSHFAQSAFSELRFIHQIDRFVDQPPEYSEFRELFINSFLEARLYDKFKAFDGLLSCTLQKKVREIALRKKYEIMFLPNMIYYYPREKLMAFIIDEANAKLACEYPSSH